VVEIIVVAVSVAVDLFKLLTISCILLMLL